MHCSISIYDCTEIASLGRETNTRGLHTRAGDLRCHISKQQAMILLLQCLAACTGLENIEFPN